MKATKIRDLSVGNYVQSCALYRLEPPLEEHELVVVSAALVPYSGPETYIFPADADGDIASFGELEGSYRGDLSHAVALQGAGYTIEESL